MTYRLIIKGSLHDALTAARAHGVMLRTMMWQANEVHAYADCDAGLLTRWLCEDPSFAPFPVGSLLHYTDGNNA